MSPGSSGAHRDHRVQSGSRGFIQARLGVAVFIWVSVSSGRRVNSGSHEFTRARIGVAEFICARVGSLGLV